MSLSGSAFRDRAKKARFDPGLRDEIVQSHLMDYHFKENKEIVRHLSEEHGLKGINQQKQLEENRTENVVFLTEIHSRIHRPLPTLSGRHKF